MSACAAHQNLMVDKPAPDGEVAGFWLGLWHGIICPITFIISICGGDINIYEVHNNGGWYNFGFLLGLAMVYGGSDQAADSARQKHT